MTETVEELNAEILQQYDDNKQLYFNFLTQVENLINQLIDLEKVSSITTRLKDKDSLANKIRKKQKPLNNEDGYKYNNLTDITDICGIRICTFYSDDVDYISKIIEDEFIIDENNTIDKRKSLEPDRFGYLSLHYIVSLSNNRLNLPENRFFNDLKIEIQIRSILQHTWAEIEHDLGYKSSDGIPKTIKRDFSRLAGLLELADKEFVSIRNNLNEYKDNVNKSIESIDLQTEILIDRVSLKEFIKSEQFNQQILFIKNNLPEEITNSNDNISDEQVDKIVIGLEYLNLTTISDLSKCLNQSSKFFIKSSENDLRREKYPASTFHHVALLYFVLYYQVFSQNLGFDGLANIFNILSVGNISEDYKLLLEDYQNMD